jgi:hypothetical protein
VQYSHRSLITIPKGAVINKKEDLMLIMGKLLSPVEVVGWLFFYS